MTVKHTNDISTSLVLFSLKVIGLWFATSRAEKYFRRLMTTCAVILIAFFASIQLRNLFFHWNDLSSLSYYGSNFIGTFLGLCKILLAISHKRKLLYLIMYMQKNFWHSNYDSNEKMIMADVKRLYTYLACVFSINSYFTIMLYIVRPIIVNIGRNTTDRILIYPMLLDQRFSKTPYFEITFVLQAMSSFYATLSYICIDNVFGLICFHLVGQFRILQYRFEKIHKISNKRRYRQNFVCSSNKSFVIFRNCIRNHQALIEYCALLEEVFSVILLFQLISFSMLYCFVGYQVFVMNLNRSVQISLTFFLMGCMCQLWMCTYSCDGVMHESDKIADVTYAVPWMCLPMNKFGKVIRKDLQFVIMRSRSGCTLTAGGFFSINLETFTKVISTAISYFTILIQRPVN